MSEQKSPYRAPSPYPYIGGPVSRQTPELSSEAQDLINFVKKADPSYDASEQDVVMDTFVMLLRSATKDGGHKRAAGLKPPWWRDPAHEPAIFSHLSKWKHGELADADSGAHPLVHAAWRCLAIAYQDTYGKRDPAPTTKAD